MGTSRASKNLLLKKRRKPRLEAAMREVHENIPSTVMRANVHGKKREAMLRAIAFAKARGK